MLLIFEVLIQRSDANNERNRICLCSTRDHAYTTAEFLNNADRVVAFKLLSHHPNEIAWGDCVTGQWKKFRANATGFSAQDIQTAAALPAEVLV